MGGIPAVSAGEVNVVPVVGTLEGYDQLMNLVLDHVKETMRGMLVSEKVSLISNEPHRR